MSLSIGCSRRRLISNGTDQPGGSALVTRWISTSPFQGTPSRCLSESIKRSRWLSTGQTGTQEPHIIHSCVKRLICVATSSETVAWFRSAIWTVDDIGIGQVPIQRSQPIHISISNCSRLSLNVCISVRCPRPATIGGLPVACSEFSPGNALVLTVGSGEGEADTACPPICGSEQ